ncbi:hypothetical protein [Streptomyces winkii]|uniref:hypothetical protein n=1 Tax=Streptomyces winkii TaxID=3051178 RepID=UPI0028D69D1A|nr:hypothetical protein [Streptomyces sp. DSM 40971]
MNSTGKALATGAAAVLALASGATTAASASPAPAAEASASHIKERESNKNGSYGIVVGHWHKKGSKYRGVNWVYASKDPAKKAHHARWLYKQPGGKVHVGKSWKKGKYFSKEKFTEVNWYTKPPGGKKLRKGSLVCTQFKGSGKKTCIKLN